MHKQIWVVCFLIACMMGIHGSEAQEKTGAPPILGLEPGDIRLCNDDIGVILWGPDHSPTLSIGKSDV